MENRPNLKEKTWSSSKNNRPRKFRPTAECVSSVPWKQSPRPTALGVVPKTRKGHEERGRSNKEITSMQRNAKVHSHDREKRTKAHVTAILYVRT